MGFMFVSVKGIPRFWVIVGLFGYSLLGCRGMLVFEGKTGLEHFLERFVPVETEGPRQEIGLWAPSRSAPIMSLRLGLELARYLEDLTMIKSIVEEE